MNNLLSQHQPLESQPSESYRLLQKMSSNWERRAQVRTSKQDAETVYGFESDRPDFRQDLLPFKDREAFLQASPQVRNTILSCGWLAYNEKTIQIEAQIVTPACYEILKGNIPGASDEVSQQIASETLVDESFHVLLVNRACCITRKHRGLESLKLPNSHLVSKMYREQEGCRENWQKILVGLVTAIVSEVFISDYLELLADDLTIQPFNRIVVDTHRRDEIAHSCIFKNLAKCIYPQLNPAQKQFFAQILPKPVRWFANMELTIWEAMLEQIGFAPTQEVIADCAATNEVNLMRIDYSGVTALARELGILDSACGAESFGREGLLG